MNVPTPTATRYRILAALCGPLPTSLVSLIKMYLSSNKSASLLVCIHDGGLFSGTKSKYAPREIALDNRDFPYYDEGLFLADVQAQRGRTGHN
jgi:hypothetical protein